MLRTTSGSMVDGVCSPGCDPPVHAWPKPQNYMSCFVQSQKSVLSTSRMSVLSHISRLVSDVGANSEVGAGVGRIVAYI